MKMEVLSVQNQFQGQFGVIGSTKVKDWTSPLTPPPSSLSSRTKGHHNLNNHQDVAAVNQQAPISTSASSNSAVAAAAAEGGVLIEQFSSVSSIEDSSSLHALSLRLQNELRAAKTRHLACTEVLLPADLLHRVAAEMIKVSEKEPCGIRGCSVYIEFEDEPSNTRRIASLKVDPNTVSTFELYLTLKHDRSGWTSMLPQFLKNLARSSTIMISPEFILTKNKLYHSFSE